MRRFVKNERGGCPSECDVLVHLGGRALVKRSGQNRFHPNPTAELGALYRKSFAGKARGVGYAYAPGVLSARNCQPCEELANCSLIDVLTQLYTALETMLQQHQHIFHRLTSMHFILGNARKVRICLREAGQHLIMNILFGEEEEEKVNLRLRKHGASFRLQSIRSAKDDDTVLPPDEEQAICDQLLQYLVSRPRRGQIIFEIFADRFALGFIFCVSKRIEKNLGSRHQLSGESLIQTNNRRIDDEESTLTDSDADSEA